MRCISIGQNEYLAYDDRIAGFFSDYRDTANHGIHRVENRKLTEEEFEKLLEAIEKLGSNIDTEPTNEDYKMLNNIATYYPEVRYFIYGLDLVEAKTPKRILKKKATRTEEQKAKEEKRAADRASKMPKEPAKEPVTEPAKETVKEPTEEAKDEPKRAEEKSAGDILREAEEKKAKEKSEEVKPKEEKAKEPTSLKKEPLVKKDEPKEEDEKVPEESKEPAKKDDKLDKEIKKLGQVGKEKYGGFKGLLFDMFKSIKDPKTREEKERVKKELAEEWKRYHANKKILDQNRELVDSMRVQLDKGELTPESIALMSELITRDNKWAKEINLDIDTPNIVFPIKKIAEHLKLSGDVSVDELEKHINKLFKDEDIENVKFKMDLEKGLMDVKTDWNNATKLLNKFNIKTGDLVKKALRGPNKVA